MLTTLTLLAALTLTAGDGDGLRLTNVRTTYGILGPTRPDNKFLPGDRVVLSFDMEGVKPAAGGKILYSIGMEALDRDDKVIFKQAPRDLEAPKPAASESVPACATLDVGLDTPPGKYTIKVTVKDRSTNKSFEVSRNCEVLPKGFGLVRLALTNDEDAKAAAAYFRTGQMAYVNFTAVGFGRDAGTNQPHLSVVLSVLDEEGKTTLGELVKGEVTQGVAEKALAHPMQFRMEPKHAGKFTLEVKATDKVTGATATVTIPVTIKDAK
jgi:hypothetical protein